MSPQDTAVYWIEYIIRHHGAPHLQYPGIHLNFFQRNSLDVIAFLLASLWIIFKISKIVIKLILKKIKKVLKGKKD